MARAFANQIGNRNFLSPVGFRFTLAKEPKAAFFCNAARIPEINLGTATQPSYLKDIPVPGEKIEYGDFSLKFLVDENLANYMVIHNWIKGLGFPETTEQFKQLTTEDGQRDMKLQFSDGSLHILDSNQKSVGVVKFKDLFPVTLSSLEFDASLTDTNYFTAEATFKYTVYDILDPNGRSL